MEKEVKEEFLKIRSEFSDYQKTFDKRLDDLFDEIRKPLLTYKEIAAIALGIVSYTYFITTDFSEVKATSNSNKENIEKTTQKIDKIYDIVFEMNKNQKK